MAEKIQISTPKAPGAIGPYSQGIKIGGWIYSAGQISLVPETGELITGDVKDHARQVLNNIKGILESSGAGFENVIKTTIYLANLNDFAAVNEVYGEYFRKPYPARSTVQVAALPKGAPVEIEVVAYIGK